MNKKWLPYVLIVVLAAMLLVVRRCNQPDSSVPSRSGNSATNAGPGSSGPGSSPQASSPPGSSGTSPNGNADPASVNRNRGFDRRVSYIEYTRHGKCRMECRHITQAEVEEIMRVGNIDYKKSDVNARPCPEYALEGTTSDGQRVRIVFAQCDLKTKVVTTIDLGENWTCDCPGDPKK